MRSTFPQLRQHLRRANLRRVTCAEQLALCELHRAVAQSTCAEQLAQTNNLHRAHAQSACTEQLAQSTCAEQLAQSTCAEQPAQSTCAKRLHGATGAEQLAQTNLHRAHAQSACTEQLAQSTCAEQLAQSTCAEQLAQSTCVQQVAESNLRAAAWNNAACADHFHEKTCGAVREETRMMRWSSHVTIHIEHCREQTRLPQRCKKVYPRLDEHLGKNAFGPIVL